MKKKCKKDIKFWERLQPIVGKGVDEEIKRVKKNYNRHRARSQKK